VSEARSAGAGNAVDFRARRGLACDHADEPNPFSACELERVTVDRPRDDDEVTSRLRGRSRPGAARDEGGRYDDGALSCCYPPCCQQ
jgi:hypothetical protein